jgi:GT2 family glycosyltransferase
MALICMAVHDTEENGRTRFTSETLRCLLHIVDLYKNRLVIIDNGSCEETKIEIAHLLFHVRSANSVVITLPENIGTAKAINKGIAQREPGEFVIKMDNDVVIHKNGWIEDMEDVMRRMPQIGILGLKRVDLQESVYSLNTDQRTRLLEVTHETGQRWRVVEDAKIVMGTCTMFNPALLDKIGGMYQMDGLYGFDDCLMCVRSTLAGFSNCFLHGIDIDHIDPGGTEYTKWKEKHAGEMLSKYGEVEAAYKTGVRNIFEPL